MKEETIEPRKSHQMDMTNGGLVLKMIIFALPLAASSILQQLFNSVDVAVVGRYAGSNALAAVGSNATLVALFVNVFTGLSVGVNVTIASFMGQKKTRHVQDVLHTSMCFAAICGICIMLAGQFIAGPLLTVINTPEDVIAQATVYLRIYFLGMPFIIIYNFGAAVLRSIGDTKRPLYCLIISGLINVGLNLIFVRIYHLDVAGVAIATAISNVVSASMVLYMLCHEEEIIRLHLNKLKIHKIYLFKVLRIGTPAALQTAVFSISNVLIQSGINSFGSNAVAGSSSALNFEYFTYAIISAYSQAAVTFTSQNYGAGKLQRCKRVFVTAMIEGMIFTALLSGIFVLGRHTFIKFYTVDEAVIAYAMIRMMHVMAVECMTGTYEISAGALRGLGRSMLPALLTVIGSVGFRIVWLFTVFRRYHSFGMLMNVYPVSWVLTAVLVLSAYFIVTGKLYAGENKNRR
jgi:putative MATE family efflux protein